MYHYSRGLVRRRAKQTKVVVQREPQTLKEFDKLDLGVLLRIRKAIDEYSLEQVEVDRKNRDIDALNKLAQHQYDKDWTKYKLDDSLLQREIAATKKLKDDLYYYLYHNKRIGFFAGAFKNYIQLDSVKLEKTDENMRSAERYKLLDNKIKTQEATLYSRRAPLYPSSTPIVKSPKDWIKISFNGLRLRVPLHGTVQEIDRAIEAKKIELGRDEEKRSREKERVRTLKERVLDLKARAAQNEEDVRQQARSQRNRIHMQLAIYKNCPYCSNPLNEGEIHLDHIYPVSKGGKSTSKNLVFICRDCNSKKSNHTLRTFLAKQSLRHQTVHETLDLLGKDF